jgi:aspartate 1-decarboxylase
MDVTWFGDRIQKTLMPSKFHRIVVTDSDLKYVGSITVVGYLIDSAGMMEFEQVMSSTSTSTSSLAADSSST